MLRHVKPTGADAYDKLKHVSETNDIESSLSKSMFENVWRMEQAIAVDYNNIYNRFKSV